MIAKILAPILQSTGKNFFNMDVYMKFSILLIVLSIHGWVQTAEARFSVTTYNIRNFDRDHEAGQTNIPELGKIIREMKSDVMGFEEVVNQSAFDSLIKSNLTGYQYVVSDCGGFGNQHLAVAYNPKVFEYMHHVEDLSFSGNSSSKCGSLRPLFLVTLRNKSENRIYTFGAVHLKAGGNDRAYSQRWKQYAKLQRISQDYKNQNLILLGDFNTTGFNLKNEDYEKFESVISQSGLRTLSEEQGCTNYWHGTEGGPEFQPSILDHIVVQDQMVRSVESVRVGSHCAKLDCRPATPQDLGVTFENVSDHCPVQVTFR